MTWLKDIPEWVPTVLVTPLVLGVGWLFKTRRADRLAHEAEIKAERAAHALEIRELRASYDAKLEAANGKVESLLNDAIAREKEATKAAAEDAELVRQRMEISRATNDLLRELARDRARKGGDA